MSGARLWRGFLAAGPDRVSSGLIIGLEMGGVLGVVLVWGFWELWSLKRDKLKRQSEEKKPGA
jgi:hypothetical protein